MPKKFTQENFIEKAKATHGDKYDYSKVNYINCYTKVCIICPIHGEFYQTPANHLRGQNCPHCCGRLKMTTEEFIVKAKATHGDKYDYSKVEYVNNETKVCTICPSHGEFYQTPHNHLNGQGCPYCYGRLKMTTEEFIAKAKLIHGNKYDYSKVNYNNNSTKVCIICPEHGEFWQKPNDHLNGHGCSECYLESKKDTQEEFIAKAKLVHGDKYDYSKVEYIDSKTSVCIICPEHGEFWQKPVNHIRGCGCPRCLLSKGELKIKSILDNMSINYIHDKDCLTWLSPQRPDFYLPDYNIIIEYDGEQHYKSVEYFGGNDAFNMRKQNDIRKNEKCAENGVYLYRISYIDFNDIEDILTKILK